MTDAKGVPSLLPSTPSLNAKCGLYKNDSPGRVYFAAWKLHERTELRANHKGVDREK